ncbi:MAG: hypothetical protein ABIQ04_02360 [Candidatus Saccharimonadales bacterium]
MNTPRKWSFTRVRVAALMLFSIVLVTGCSTTTATPSPSVPQSKDKIIVADFVQADKVPPGTDLVKTLSSGEKLPGMDSVAKTFGVDDIFAPKDRYLSKGYIGVGPLGAKCILVMVVTPGTVDPSHMAVIIAHRLDSDPGKMIGIGSVDELAPYVKSVLGSPLCAASV